MFKKYDIVEVYKQPHNQCVKLDGEILLIISDIENGYCEIESVREIEAKEVILSGCGTLPINCLRHITDERKIKIAQKRIKYHAG